MSVGLARVTISAPQRRVDVALPEHVPLAELLPEVLQHAGEGLADDGEKHGGWLLRRADGVALATGQGLHPQGVRDGEILHLVPAGDEWPELEYDDVVEAIAEGARRRGGIWTPSATRAATLAAAAVPLTLGLITLLTAGPGQSAGPAGLGVATLLTLAATMASRAYGDARAGVALGGYALPYAFAGGAAVVTSHDEVGILPLLPWIGSPELLAGSLSVLLFAAFGGMGVAAGSRLFTAGVTAGLLGAFTALVGLIATPTGAAAVLISVLVCGIGLLPLLAVRLGRTPRPPITQPAGEAETPDPARERLDRADVFAAVTRTEELLAGMLLAHAVLAAGAFAALAAAGTLSARILIAVSATALLLRSRLFVTRRQRIPLLAGGLAGFAALGADLLSSDLLDLDQPGLLPAVLAAATLIALLTVAIGTTYAERAPSPYIGRAADLLDALAVIAVIPMACAVTGLFSAVSGIT
ncbi:type VII secretion integral membrane protein EccD [Actinoplanes sp. NPDC024001]|uniref:type VII secretion integral membrane protein EccD n=1 Tax=Actinoplanes sp. NPDC024001 TaxID=3154598 RepID=UPI00340829BF